MEPFNTKLELQQLVYTLTELSMQTKMAHWNVEGRDFKPFHNFFEELYSTVTDLIDPTAEHIRALDPNVNFVEFYPDNIKMQTILIELSFESSKDPIKTCFTLGNNFIGTLNLIDRILTNIAPNLHGLRNFLEGSYETLNKYKWQLTAISK